jgi:hypothetical protein
MTPTVYRNENDKMRMQDQFTYSRALNFDYVDHEPIEVTKARSEIKSWLQTIFDHLERGFSIVVPARIFYVYQMTNSTIQESKSGSLK